MHEACSLVFRASKPGAPLIRSWPGNNKMITTLLVVLSGSILALLGTAHMILTFRGPKLLPRDRELVQRMQEAHLMITDQTTFWRAWIGFNASHSLGAMFFGFIYSYLAVVHPEVLFTSVPLQMCGLVVLATYLLLAMRYWFITPIAGIAIALMCYVVAMALAWT